MRRFYLSLAAVGFLGAMVGCHTAGACDCAGPGNPCCYGNFGAPLAPTQWSALSVHEAGEPPQAMPKAEVKGIEAGPGAPVPEKLAPPADAGKPAKGAPPADTGK